MCVFFMCLYVCVYEREREGRKEGRIRSKKERFNERQINLREKGEGRGLVRGLWFP